MMIVQQNTSPLSSGVHMPLLSKKHAGVLALPSVYCLPIIGYIDIWVV